MTQVTVTKPHEDAVIAKAIKHIMEHWDMDAKELAAITGVSPSVISRIQQTSAFAPSKLPGKMALLLIRAYRSLGAFLGDRMSIQQEWLRAHHHVFNQSPIEAMKTPEGLVHVVRYLDAMRGAEG